MCHTSPVIVATALRGKNTISIPAAVCHQSSAVKYLSHVQQPCVSVLSSSARVTLGQGQGLRGVTPRVSWVLTADTADRVWTFCNFVLDEIATKMCPKASSFIFR
jgi:hypothetical protein